MADSGLRVLEIVGGLLAIFLGVVIITSAVRAHRNKAEPEARLDTAGFLHLVLTGVGRLGIGAWALAHAIIGSPPPVELLILFALIATIGGPTSRWVWKRTRRMPQER